MLHAVYSMHLLLFLFRRWKHFLRSIYLSYQEEYCKKKLQTRFLIIEELIGI